MAVQNEIIKLLLQFETAFTSQDTFSNFVNKTTTELNNLDSKIKDSSEEFNKLFNVLKLGNSGAVPLKELFKDLSQASDVKAIVENTKILKQSIESLQQVLDKKLNITNLETSLAKIQEKFIPSKGIGAEKSADFAGKFLKTIEEQFKSFASGSMDLNTFFDNLFPKDITAKGTTAKIKSELANLKSEVEKGINDLTNLTTEKRFEVLEFISKKILADSTKLSVAASAVKGDGKQLVDAIVSMAAALQDIGFLPPKDFFPNFTQGLKEQGAVQKDVIRNVLKDLMAQFNVAGFELEKNDIAFKLLERLGFNKSTLEAQFKELSSTAQKEFEKFNSSIRQAIESPKTLNLDTYIKEFQSFMTNAFKNNALVSFGDEFQAQFKKVSTELNGFTRTATQSLGEVNNFEQGIKSLINALDSGKGAGTPASLALKELLETYLQVEKQFRFDQVLKTQEQAISEFDKKFKELTNTLKNNQPPEYSLKLVTKASAGDEAFKEREVALATYNTLLKQTTEELDRTARSIAHLENIQKSTTATEDQKTSLNNLIDRYKTYQQSLSDEANILRKNQANWDATWLRKTQDLSLAEERVKNFFKVLNQSSDAGTITGTTSYLKGLLDIGVKSTESAQALESAFKIFSNFGGVTKESLQYLELFEKAIGSLFKSMGQGEGKVTLIDLSGLKAQADGTVVATETLRNELIKLAGSSKEAQENFQNLAFANDFLAKTQGAADTAFGKQISALFSLAQAAKLYVNNIENLILKNDLYEQNLRKVQAAELEVRESFKKVQNSPQDPSAVNALTQAYQKYTREIAAAELRLKELKNLQTELATQKNTFGFTEAGQQLPGLEAGIRSTTALIEQLKNKILDLRTSGGGSKIFEDIIRGVEQGNQQLKSSFDALEKDLSGRLLAITEKLNTNLSKGSIGKGLFKQIQGEISNLSIALKTVNVDGALQAIQALVAKIQTALDPKNVPVNKELAQTYLAPIKELLNGLEVAQGAIARIIPKLGEGQKGKAEELLKNVQTQIIATNTALENFGQTANTAQLTTRFEEAKLKARELNAEISRLGKGSFDQTKYNDFELRLQGINNQYKAISKENESFGAGLRISELNNLIDTASRSLKDFGKTTNFDTLNNQLIALRDKFPTLNADIADFDKLFREAFAGTKTAINIKPLIDLKNEVQDVKNNLKNPAQDTLYTTLLRQLDALINKTTIYNATVKAGASKADVGVQAFIDPAAVNASKASLQALEAELNNNKIALDTFLKSGNQTKETATQIAEGFKVTDNSVKSLTAEIGLLSGVSSNLLHHINALKAAGADASAFEAFRASIEAIIKTKKDLDTQFKGGSLTGKLKEDLDRLVDVKDALSQFKTVGDSFKSAAFFESTSYSARQALEEIQRLTSAMRTVSSDIGKSLSVSRTGPINPEIEKELRAQQKLADEAIIKLREMGAVYSQLNSKPKNESFQQLKETIEQAFGGGVTGLRAFRTEFDTLIRGVSTSSASLISGVAPLMETLINSFKQQSESIIATRTQYEAWLNLLRSEKAAGQKTFTLPDGSTRSIDRLITVFQNLLDKANAVKAPIEAAATTLKGKLDTAAGQAEVRIDKLVNKFTQLQDRINTLNPGSSINEMYGSIKELMMLLDRPYKTGPFFTLPKESFAPIRNELQSVLEVAKNVQAGLEFNLTSLTKGSLAYKDTQTAIKAAREEVERLTAASQKLSEFEKNASHFSTLRGNLHGASTTLQELAHEGAFIYKGLEALFKNLAKNLTGPTVTINTATLNQQLDQLTTKFGVTGTAADHLKTQVKEALNAQLGGGGLAAAEQYQKAFQQLEEAFVKFRSGLTQAAMGFQMLGDSLLEPFKKAKENYEQFSDTMGVVNAVSNATQAQFKALTDQALLMGATTRFTAEQAAEGLKQLAKAGYTAEEQIASLPTVMRLAQAAATDLATAATVATVVMKEFRMDPDQFNVAADKITLAANRTLGTVEDLGYSFKYVGALAANIGADFGDLTAAIGLLHNAGLKGTLAGTALRGMLMNLYNPTKQDEVVINQLSERIGGLGLQIQDANGNFLGFSAILKQLEQAGITSAEVLKLFGQRAGPGMAALLAQGSDALIKLEQDLKNAEGTTAHMAEIMEQTLKGKLLLMRSAFQALSDQIGHNLAPTLMLAADAMADFVSRFVALREEFPVLASTLDHVLGGLALFASVLGGLAVTFAFILVPVKQFYGFLKTLVVTTLAGAGAITSLSAAQAFNAKITLATVAAAEREFTARLAQAVATGAASNATTYNTIATGINVVAIREQMVALHGATAAAGAHAAAQAGMWTGIKNIVLGLGKSLLNIGGMLKWAVTTPMGLAFTAVTSIVAATLLHEKSVSQANEELKKQGDLLTYSQKEALGLSAALVNTSEKIKQTQEQLNQLANKRAEQNGLSPTDQSQVAQLQIELDFDQQKLNEQLRELYTRLSEDGSKLKDKVSFEVALDETGTFTQFKVNVKGATEAIDVFANGTAGAAEQLKKLAPELDRVADAEKRLLAQQQLGNTLRKNLGSAAPQNQTDFGRNIDVLLDDLAGLIGIGPRVAAAEKEVARAERLIEYYEAVQKKLATLDPYQAAASKYGSLDSVSKRLDELKKSLTESSLELNDILKESVDATLNNIVESTGLSAETVARLPNLADIIKEKTKITFEQEQIDFKYFDDVVIRLEKQFKDLENATTVTEITSGGFKKPFNEIVSALVNFESALEEKNKELKKLIKEQGDIFKDVKPLADAIKKYEDSFIKFDKANADQKVKNLEFDVKVNNDQILSDLTRQLEQVTLDSKVVDLPVSINSDFSTTKSSIVKGMESVRGIVLNYEKAIDEDLISLKIQQATQEYETVVQNEQAKQQTIRESLVAIGNLYQNKNAEFYQLEQEKLTALVDSLKSEYDATVSHVNKLYALRAGLAQKSQQLDSEYINRQATAASNLQKLAVGSKSDNQKRNFLKEQIKALKELADEATSTDNLDRAKALLDQQQQLITQAIGEVASTKGKGGYKAFLKESQEQNLEDTGNVIDGLKSQSSAAQDLLTAQIEENKNRIKELSVEAKDLGVTLTEALKELQKTTELDIGISADSYEKVRQFAEYYKNSLRELNDFEIRAATTASDPQNLKKATEELTKAKQQQLDIEKQQVIIRQANEVVKPVLATQGVSNALSDITQKTTELYQLLNNTDGELDDEELQLYEKGVESIQQRILGLQVALKDANLNPELRKQIENLIVLFSGLNIGDGLAKQVEKDGEAFVKQSINLFKKLESDSKDSGEKVGKQLKEGYVGALTDVIPTLKKLLNEAIKGGDVSSIRDIAKLTEEAINQTITKIEELQKLKQQGLLTDADLVGPNQLLQALREIKNEAKAVRDNSLEIKTTAPVTTPVDSTKTLSNQDTLNKKLEEQKQQQQNITQETENTTAAVINAAAVANTAVDQTNVLKDSVVAVKQESNLLKDAWVAFVTTIAGAIPAAQAAGIEVAKLNDSAQTAIKPESTGLLNVFSAIKQSAKDTYAEVVNETSAFFDKVSNTKINLTQLERNFLGFFTNSVDAIHSFTTQVETVDLATPLNKEIDTVLRASERLTTELSNTALSSFVTDTTNTFEQFATLINNSINGLNISDAFGREVDLTLQGLDKLKTNVGASTFGQFIDETVTTFSTFSTLVNAEIEKIDLSATLGRETAQAVDAVTQGSTAIVDALGSSSLYVDWLKPFADNTKTTLSTLNTLASNEISKFVQNFDLSQTSEIKGFANFIDLAKQKGNELVDAFGNTTEAQAFFKLFDLAVDQSSKTLTKLGEAGKQQGEELNTAFRQALFAYNLWKNEVETPVQVDNTAFETFKNTELQIAGATTAAVNFLQTLPQLQTQSERISIFGTLTNQVRTVLEESKTIFNNALVFMKVKAEKTNFRLNVKTNKEQAGSEAVLVSQEINQKIQSNLTPYDISLKIVNKSEQDVQEVLLKGLNILNEYTKPQIVDIRYVYQDADRLDELTKKIKELRSQQPQGIFKTPLVDSAELQQLQQLLLQEYSKPILLDVTNAQRQNTDLKNEIAKPVVANVNLKKAESELSVLLARRKELEINPKVNTTELTALNLQIKNLENKIINIKLKAPDTSSYSPLGAESIIKSGEISNALRTSLNEAQQFKKSVDNIWTNTTAKQGVKMDLDTVELEHQLKDAEGKVQIWHEQVKRLTATGLDIGGKQLTISIPNFQVQASTWDDIVSEGNRYMKLTAQVAVDPSFANQIQDVKPVVTPVVAADQVNAQLNNQIMQEKVVKISSDTTDFSSKVETEASRIPEKVQQLVDQAPPTVLSTTVAVDDTAVKDQLNKPNIEEAVTVPVVITGQEKITELQNQIHALTANPFIASIQLFADEARSGISSVLSLLDEVTRPRTTVVKVRYETQGTPPTQGRNQGGIISRLQYFAEGGLAKFKELASAFVPGSGDQDTVPAMLTPGEFVVKKDRVKSIGVGFLNALNNGLVQFKAAGGMIYNSPVNTLNKMSNYIQPNYQVPQQTQPASGPSIDINLTIKDKKFNIKTPRDQVDGLVSAFKQLNRTL